MSSHAQISPQGENLVWWWWWWYAGNCRDISFWNSERLYQRLDGGEIFSLHLSFMDEWVMSLETELWKSLSKIKLIIKHLENVVFHLSKTSISVCLSVIFQPAVINDAYCLPSSGDFIIFIIICFSFFSKISPNCRPVFVSCWLIVSASCREISQHLRIYVGNKEVPRRNTALHWL